MDILVLEFDNKYSMSFTEDRVKMILENELKIPVVCRENSSNDITQFNYTFSIEVSKFLNIIVNKEELRKFIIDKLSEIRDLTKINKIEML